MKTRSAVTALWAALFLLMAAGRPLLSQETAQASPDKILGTWNLEINVETEYYYVSLTLRSTEGALEGTASEQSGSFSEVPLTDITFDGTALAFTFNAPTPPDGLTRAVFVELKVVDDQTMEGSLSVPDLGVSGAMVKATKQ